MMSETIRARKRAMAKIDVNTLISSGLNNQYSRRAVAFTIAVSDHVRAGSRVRYGHCAAIFVVFHGLGPPDSCPQDGLGMIHPARIRVVLLALDNICRESEQTDKLISSWHSAHCLVGTSGMIKL